MISFLRQRYIYIYIFPSVLYFTLQKYSLDQFERLLNAPPSSPPPECVQIGLYATKMGPSVAHEQFKIFTMD